MLAARTSAAASATSRAMTSARAVARGARLAAPATASAAAASAAANTPPPAPRSSVVARAGFAPKSTKKVDAAAPRMKLAGGEIGADAEAVAAARKEKRAAKSATEKDAKAGTAPKGFPDGWSQLDGTVDELLPPKGKATKAVTLRTGRVLVLYRLGDTVFCSDVESPAYKYPMHEARVFSSDAAGLEGGDVPAAECPLDGSVFDLRTGAPLVYCPNDRGGGLVRGMLSALKQKSEPSPMQVHPVFVDGAKRVYVKVRAAK